MHQLTVSHAYVFSNNPPPALLAKWLGSFTCYYGNTVVEEVLKLESAQKVVSVADLSLEKKNQPVIAILVIYSWPLTDCLPLSESFSLSLYFVFSASPG